MKRLGQLLLLPPPASSCPPLPPPHLAEIVFIYGALSISASTPQSPKLRGGRRGGREVGREGGGGGGAVYHSQWLMLLQGQGFPEFFQTAPDI